MADAGTSHGTPMILMTAVTAATGISFADRSAEAQSWLKADCFLDKPVRPEQLKAEVRRALAGRAKA